jgi:helix-turn-helix protein
MSESVVADFVGRFHTPDVDGGEPVRGRVVLSQRRLVLVAGGGKTTVPLSAVFDVVVGTVPPNLQAFFKDTVTVAYRDGAGKQLAVVEAEAETMARFRTVLFKALLRDVTVTVRNPARVGGRVTDVEPEQARIKLAEGSLRFVGCSNPFEVDLSAVTHVERDRRSMGGTRRQVISFRHMPDGRAITSDVAIEDGGKQNIFGRYIRLEYASVVESLEDVEPTDEELEALVTLYSAGGGVHLGDLINVDASQLTMVLNSLAEDGLIVDGDDATRLTPRGQALVSRRLEQVNA